MLPSASIQSGMGGNGNDAIRRGQRLRAARERARMTQDQAALAIGIAKTTYQKKEQGQRGMTADFINKACEVFGVRPEEILSEINSRADPASGPLVEIDKDRLASLIELSKNRLASLSSETAKELLLALIEAARKP